MLVVVSYDVSTESPEGCRRLRHIAKICKDYGQRVQNSVFECIVDPAQWAVLKKRLLDEANMEQDSLRFYFLGRNWKNRVEHYGIKSIVDFDEPIIV